MGPQHRSVALVCCTTRATPASLEVEGTLCLDRLLRVGSWRLFGGSCSLVVFPVGTLVQSVVSLVHEKKHCQ